jgi:hypothetical protein
MKAILQRGCVAAIAIATAGLAVGVATATPTLAATPVPATNLGVGYTATATFLVWGGNETYTVSVQPDPVGIPVALPLVSTYRVYLRYEWLADGFTCTGSQPTTLVEDPTLSSAHMSTTRIPCVRVGHPEDVRYATLSVGWADNGSPGVSTGSLIGIARPAIATSGNVGFDNNGNAGGYHLDAGSSGTASMGVGVVH